MALQSPMPGPTAGPADGAAPIPQSAPTASAAKPPLPPGAAPVAHEEQPPPEALLPHITFWQQPWVQNVLPFVTSLVTHAVIVILGITAAQVIINKSGVLKEEQTIIPESTMADAG